MTVSVTLVSEDDLILRLVRDFAHGLDCPVDMGPLFSGRCHVTYPRGVTSDLTPTLPIAEFRIDTAAQIGA